MMETARFRPSPFRSLDFFTTADAAVFAGREEEIEEVATRILAGPTLVVYGPSGVGKTSLLCAGVVPALENRRGYRVTYVRPLLSPRGDVWKALGADPEQPLAAALTRLAAPDAAALEAPIAASPGAPAGAAIQVSDELSRILRRTTVAPHVLILDQLEELFTRFEEPQRRPLWDGLVEVLDNPRAPIRLVLSLREEYLHVLDSAHPRLSSLLDRRFRLRGLAPFGARTAIVRPLVAARIRYEPELVDRCVADLTEVPAGHSDEDGVVDPLLLQIVSSEVYREAEQRNPGAPSLTLAGYAELGGPAGVFRHHLDELFNRVDPGDHLLLKLVLQEMTTAHATKLPTTLSRLSQAGLLASPEELQRLLDKLVAANLVRKYAADPEPWYELVHDRLVHALPQHFSADQQFLRLRYMRELVSQLALGLAAGMVGAPLLNRQQLADLVEPFRRYLRFSEPELNLLFRSAVAHDYHVAVWRDAFEAVAPGKPRAVLFEMMSYPETRRGAMTAVGVLGVTDPAHRARCLDVALVDNDVATVNDAARALRSVAGPEEAARLIAVLKDRKLRARALWLLAELTDNPAVRAQAPRRVLRLAQREHDRREVLQNWEVVQQGSVRGLKIGLAAALPSGIATLAFWCIVMTWLGDTQVSQYAASAVVIALACATLSAVCGFTAGQAMAKLQLLEQRRSRLAVVLDRATLGTIAATLVLGALFVTASLVAISDALAISLQDAVSIALGLCPVLTLYLLASIGLAAWTLPAKRWHQTRSPIAVFLRVFSLSWTLTMGGGYLLISTIGYTSRGNDIVIAVAALLGGWCTICATSIACVVAEPIWRSSQRWRVWPRWWFSRLPMATLLALAVLLLLQTPLPFWAPTVSLVPTAATSDPEPDRPYSLPGSWTGGRWITLSNPLADPRVVSISPTGSEIQGLLLVGPGKHAQWFPPGVERLYPLRQLDLATEAPSPCTYAVVPITSGDSASTEAVRRSIEQSSLVVWRVGCRAKLSSGDVVYHDGQGSITSGGIEALSGPELFSSTLDCKVQYRPEEITAIEMIVLFESYERHCAW
jgi:hypothetical protein